MRTGLGVYTSLAALLALALSAVVLAVMHILCRGLWLAVSTAAPSDPSLPNRPGLVLDHARAVTYYAALLLLVILGFILIFEVLIMLSAGLERGIISVWSVSIKKAGWIARLTVACAFLVSFIYFRGRLSKKLRDIRLPSLPGAMVISFCVFCFMFLFVIEACYTADMDIAGKAFDRRRSDLVEVDVLLGGATSAVNSAHVVVVDSIRNPVKYLDLRDLGHGQYIGIISSRDLSGGPYQIVLDYPHLGFDLVFPFIHRRIIVTKGFLVVP